MYTYIHIFLKFINVFLFSEVLRSMIWLAEEGHELVHATFSPDQPSTPPRLGSQGSLSGNNSGVSRAGQVALHLDVRCQLSSLRPLRGCPGPGRCDNQGHRVCQL